MKVLLCASEGAPFAKTGGLADVIGALPKALKENGVDVRVMMPFYKQIKEQNKARYIGYAYVKMGPSLQYVGVFEDESDGIKYYFIDSDKYFNRENFYGYDDDGERFAYFDFAVLEALKVCDFYPDVIHANDWQTGLIPFILKANYWQHEKYNSIKTLYSIHNIQYQGIFPTSIMNILFMPYSKSLEYGDCINYMKAGILEANAVNTVSNTYKDEVLTPEFSYGLNDTLGLRYFDFYGILNGIDTDKFNPQTDKQIYKNYTSRSYISGKKANKEALLKDFGLDTDDAPLFGLVSRLVDQKGIDLLGPIMDEVIEYSNAKFILMGSGNSDYENYFRYLENKYPNRFKCYIGYNDKIAQRIYAGSDIFLMPSKFEPCGLGQMIAMRYGTLPLVRETGGLKDTVTPYNKYTGEGTGFSFTNYNSYDLKEVMFLAIDTYNNNKDAFKKMIRQAMSKDYSWHTSALAYKELYEKLMK